jgi:two-component system, OmpR family, sensor kinase
MRVLGLRSLRSRLLFVSLLLTAIGMIVVNVIALVALRSSLLGRVDQELMAIPAQVQGPPPDGTLQREPPAGPDSSGSGFFSTLVVTTLESGTGEVTNQLAGPVVSDAPAPDLSSVTAQIQTGTVTDHLQTVGAIGDSGYRYRIRVLPNTTAGQPVIVVGKSLADIESTLVKVAVVDGAVSVLIFVGLVVVGIVVIRLGLRPLTDVEQAAQRIGAGEFDVRAPHSDETGEVGSLARTFNTMADGVESAFAERDQSEQQLRQFIADASHELRTPLTTIRAYSELYSHGDGELDPELRTALQRIEAESTRMARLVDDLLVLARVDQEPELVEETVDLAEIAADHAGDFATAFPDHRVNTEHIGSPAYVCGASASLSQLTANLLRNAVVHTPPGSTVDVSVAAEDGIVTLVVADDGPGMSREDAERAFERFYRPQPGRARAVGTGLGLAIVDAVVRSLGGNVHLDTAPGDGAVFTVTLPAAKPADTFGNP